MILPKCHLFRFDLFKMHAMEVSGHVVVFVALLVWLAT